MLSEIDMADVLNSIKECIEKISQNEKANETLYQNRLRACKECEHLISGTCMKCGCYVELRAAYIKQKCPDSKNRKW